MADMFSQLEFLDVDSMVDESLANTCTFFDEDMVDGNFAKPGLFDSDNCLSSVVQVQKMQEKSPFHESDSGVSEVSDFCGSSPNHETAIMLDEMLDNMKSTSFLVDTDLTDQDIGLMSYLAGDDSESHAVTHKNVTNNDNGNTNKENNSASNQPQSVRPTRMTTRSAKSQVELGGALGTNYGKPEKAVPRIMLRGRRSLLKPSAGKEVVQSSESEEESDVDVEKPLRRSNSSRMLPKGSVKVTRPGTTLPSTTSSPNTSTNCNVTSVKIVRVKNASLSNNPEEDINKALEDRNRKNAEIAKVNRQKKKAYVEGLEQEVEEGRQKIERLEYKLNDVEVERDACRREIHYLKSVLANQSALAGLLKNIPNNTGVTLSSPSSRKRQAEVDHSYNTTKKSRPSPPQATAGVCLHVDNGNVSLEFCHHCAENAAVSTHS